jgi:hypothetical protein
MDLLQELMQQSGQANAQSLSAIGGLLSDAIRQHLMLVVTVLFTIAVLVFDNLEEI